ncbi:MAG: hypothetical protein AMJ89_01405 [candidate division Zixibacteria bacterium SM23_73]|nr:MAG: hypothetical protein AMJ89_01405 [candidate division Zixibacteria bacterium SM23_73]
MSSNIKHHTSSFCFPLLRLTFIICSLIIVAFCFYGVNSFSQIIDRIVAVVNDQVITLTDLRIAEAFSLYEDELEGESKERLLSFLERIINQKVVIEASSEDISVSAQELEAELRDVAEKLGPEEFQKKREEFGLELEDLKLYLKEKILYKNILSRRFGQRVMVNLEEIENHYEQIYIPLQEKKGLKSRPMMEILDEIESAIKQEKVKKQTADWIDNLKKQVEIEIRFNDLNEIEDR